MVHPVLLELMVRQELVEAQAVVEQAVAVGLVEHQVLQALLVQAEQMVLQEVEVVVEQAVHQAHPVQAV